MEEMTKHGQVGRAAMKADMDRKTGRKYVAAGKLPSEMAGLRMWRTREDPFAEHWPSVVMMLAAAPALEAKTIFEQLSEQHPGRYSEGQLRTLQRHVRQWRAAEGPDKEVFFPQEHRPGEAAQTDFTSTGELGITIAGEVFVHLLCVFVLPYSNWQWVTVCLSESLAAIRRGVQASLFRLGRRPTYHQTDNSTSATHNVPKSVAVVTPHSRRPFNAEYLALMRHFGMEPRTIEVGESHQNGDVEASNGALKRKIEQALLLRESRDFESRDAWERFAQGVADKVNRGRATRVAEELAVMRVVEVTRLPEFTEVDVTVTSWSTVRLARNTYSVPSRLRDESIRAHIYEERIEVFFATKHQLTIERLRGEGGRRINYRHIIWSLVQKPGAFARYRYREDLFPSLTFRRAYDAIHAEGGGDRGVRGDLDYLRILHLAASTMESEVESALDLVLGEGKVPHPDLVKGIVTAPTPIDVPTLIAPVVDLHAYDSLLVHDQAVAS